MKDILFNKDIDLDIANGDLVAGFSTLQHQEMLLINNKGSFKEFPTIGIDAFGYLQDNNIGDLLRELQMQFVGDGMQVKSVDINDKGELNIDAVYGNS
ncbi:hypothetical protein HGH92_21640 [Chitinophaga varians]|uniref:Oxidase n=1 Tax=Chitinophaga varians TaxID=2202339 RepID=A0A847RVN4_9BACT|nr:hypothetical protein [Chitinophaga varians]NLR66926.1 hypothetical protein [Chitinophaga varians]